MTRLFSGQRRGRGRFGPLASLTLTVILAGNVAAQSAGELRARAQAVDAGTSTESQRRAIEQLGELATSFIQLADKATLAGDPGAAGGELRAAYEAISGPLEAIHRSTAEATEGQVQKIIAADGDLEALYESPAYKEAQQTGAHALYFLNWLRYYGSRLYQGERRQRLLEQAQSGFSELTAGEESELSIESTLGRGLCQLDAGKLDAAIQDLRQVSESGKASAERRHKARLALLEAYSKRGHADGVLKLSQEMLADAATAEADWIRYARVRALLDKAKKTKGPAGDPLRQEAMALIDRLRRSGGAWEARVTELLHSELDNPEEWANKAGSPFAKWELAKMLAGKGDYSGALPLLQEVTASRDNALEAIQPEAQYLLGLAWFKASKMNEAAAALERALAAAKPSFAGEAAYLRFKAVEAMVASEPQSVDPARYEAALRGYLDGYPDHKSAFEARYRLGELYQAQQKFGEAIAEYRQVKGDPGFELQARFAMLQCGFELYPSTTAGERPQRLAEIDAGLRQFLSDAAKLDRKAAAQLPLAQMQAKAAVMEAVLRKLQPQPDFAAVVTALGEFETRYPQQTEL
ncbi:MAG TPA: tetratricopeptide repeat protein, partial [Terriglobales bacterium]|nr:tetratricopeptide repeat protein [Terriglobales bacterium]